MTVMGTPVVRLEGREKVTGAARYAAEYKDVGGSLAYAVIVGATVPAGRVVDVDRASALALPGVLDVLWHGNAPTLGDPGDGELQVLQSDAVSYRGQIVAVVVADTLEQAQDAASAVDVTYESRQCDNELREHHPGIYAPEQVNAGFDTDVVKGEPEARFDASPVRVDVRYTTPAEHNAPMEPHATIASWSEDKSTLTVWDSTQAPSGVAGDLAELFHLEPGRVRVVAEHVGGGFGSKGSTRPNAVVAVMASSVVGRPVSFPVPRRSTFDFVGYRTPTIQRIRLSADHDGSMTALLHDSLQQTSTVMEFVEQTSEGSRHVYDVADVSTTHRAVALDVGTPRWMRAPGECPGMFGLECAVDELAYALGMDPIELRLRNEPSVDPADGQAYTSRTVRRVFDDGSRRFGWAERDPRPGIRRVGRTLVGTGVAMATYPAMTSPSTARATARGDGTVDVAIAASDIGTGARTVLAQIAADALGVSLDRVHIHVGDSSLPTAPGAGGSSGTSSWGWAVTKACRALVADGDPAAGASVLADTADDLEERAERARQAFGAHFAEVHVDVDTGEVRVNRMLGVFSVGRVLNPRLARSQLMGGMIFGLGMAVMEEGIVDRRHGGFLNADLAEYHVPVDADVRDIEAIWVDEYDDDLNPMGSKGIGEIGNVGSAAAIANAVYHACGVRVRDLPIRLDTLVEKMDPALRL
ncbi:xanthine dehydrogenase [Rhodococcus sp. Leaf7]|uniref:xanthine dehydrogenase family protein molybdopterin-binding subunit n=1 Tax=unclassified Rhodococcus (in: high G+C Gram-positive bacteria) TaxID=192944 RepID=UPI0006FD7DE5|nr:MULTISPECIES: xanthine dehydrogenase family protein molybdopterin-binding subunit [unclassified Rhodococcus (in: high G+C Gram-positive bacteria)]KQU06572.1 xanthine dehydrogenase [Rhodococcus sp. Leaf7]KQU42090.1 xanthine dehydrogenase [Rhodococcus sp. Leaf247]